MSGGREELFDSGIEERARQNQSDSGTEATGDDGGRRSRPDEDLREAQRRPQGRPPEDDRGGRVDAAGQTLAAKIRRLRKKIRRREAQRKSQKLQKQRARRRKTQGVREAVSEARELASRGGGSSGSGGGIVRRAVSTIAGATGSPGARPAPDPDDPIARAGREAESPAPVDASLRPFGGAGSAVGPERLEMMAAGAPRQEGRRREEAPLEAFVTGDPMTNDRSQSDRQRDDNDDLYSGIVGDDDVDFVTGGRR